MAGNAPTTTMKMPECPAMSSTTVMGIGVLSSTVAAPLRHGSGIDELVFLGLPLILLAVVFLFIMRRGESDDTDAPPPDE